MNSGLQLKITTPVALTLLPRNAPRAGQHFEQMPQQTPEQREKPAGSLKIDPGTSTIIVDLAGGSLTKEIGEER